MRNTNLIVLIAMLLVIQGCVTTSTSIPDKVHINTTKRIYNLEREGDILEKEGKEKLDDLVETINQPIN